MLLPLPETNPAKPVSPKFHFDGMDTGKMSPVPAKAPKAFANRTGNPAYDGDISDYVPLLDYVLVLPQDDGEITKGGIHLTEKPDPVEGQVVAAGPGNHQNGVWIPNRVSVGMWVRFGKWAAGKERRIRVGDQVYLLMREEDCLLTRPSLHSAQNAALPATGE